MLSKVNKPFHKSIFKISLVYIYNLKSYQQIIKIKYQLITDNNLYLLLVSLQYFPPNKETLNTIYWKSPSSASHVILDMSSNII